MAVDDLLSGDVKPEALSIDIGAHVHIDTDSHSDASAPLGSGSAPSNNGSWLRRHLGKITFGGLVTGWSVFEWLAPGAAGKVHQVVLHIFWGDFVHKLLHIAK
jgi:hypothetical protein